jgi:hypothetical protein
MKPPFAKALSLACAGLCLVFACSLASPRLAAQSPQRAITLEPPAGSELQAHTFNAQGVRLPEAPETFRRLGEANLGEAAIAHTLTFRFTAATQLTGIKSTTKDFRIQPGGSCVAGLRYAADTTCTLLVSFTPQGAGNRLGRVSFTTASSPAPLAFGLGGYGYAPILSFIPSVITTVPGSYPSNVGLLNGAKNLWVDGSDTLWVSDTENNLVRNRDSSGNFKTLASGYSAPWGITVDTFGQAYFSRPAAGTINEIYDYGPVVQINGSGTGACPASTPCTLSSHTVTNPGELSMDPYNHMFFVESTSGGALSTVQPIPANLIFLYDPFPFQTNPASAAAMDSGDNIYSLWSNGGACEIVQQSLYNAENSNVAFNKIAGGHTCGFAGDGGLAGNAEIGATIGQISFDYAGDLYFSDTANQRVRRIDYTTGVIRTIAGNGTAGYLGDGGQSTAPGTLNTPTGVSVDSTGSVYIITNSASSGSAQVIRKVGPNGYINFGNQAKGTGSAAVTLYVTNTGNSTMTLASNYILGGVNGGDFKVIISGTTCPLTAGGALYSGQTCLVAFQFAPTAPGPRSAIFRLLGNTVSGLNDTTLIGNGTLPIPTFVITSPSSGASFHSGTAVTFSVSVTATSGPQPTGTVQFKVDSANYGGPVTVGSTGAASTSVTGLTQTNHTLSATYSGDASYAAAGPISVPIVVTAVKIGASVTLSPTASTSSCSPAQFAISVSSASKNVPTGQVTLLDGSRSISSGTLVNGKISLSSPPLGAGNHTMMAHYAGDSLHLPANSQSLVEAGSSGSCRPSLPGLPGGGLPTGPTMP